MKRIIMFVLLFAALKVAGQTTGYFRFDTVRIMKQNGTCELYLINKTKDSLGLLTNVGGGLTQFRKSKMLNDSTIIIGLDTLVIPGNVGATQLTDSSFIVGGDTIRITGFGGGITELTGDVTAGPGSGSQAATITNNAVTNAKLAQAAALTVKGNPTNGTANVQDIAATVDGTYLKRSSAPAIVWDSVDYAEVKNTPSTNPGVYFSPAQSFDASFVVFASAIVYPTSTFVHGTPITWGILDQATAHNSSFYDSAYGSGTQRLVVRFPTVKAVLNSKLITDESLSEQLLISGPTVGLSTLEHAVYQSRTLGTRLTGAGTSTWTENVGFGGAALWDVTTYNTADGGTSFNSLGKAVDYNQLNVVYDGPNGYTIKRVYSGLGAYGAKFILADAFGNPVTTNPTSSDNVFIVNGGMQSRQIQMSTYSSSNNEFLAGSFTNWWVDGSFECWMVAAPVSTTSVQVRWQTTYPSATNYKIYRATSLYGARTLVHTGTDGSFIDSGLSSGTLYWYFMIATIASVDTEITYFRTNTKAF